MSRLRANQITNENANGAPNFPHGITVTGIVTASTASTTMDQIVVGSAVTANSQGIDVTGIVTATSFKGDGSNLTGIDASSIKNGSEICGPVNVAEHFYRENEKKREIYLLKPAFFQSFVDDFRKKNLYKKDANYISQRLKKTG